MEEKSNMAAVHVHLLEFVIYFCNQVFFVHFEISYSFLHCVCDETCVSLGWNLALPYKCKIQSFLE